MNRAAIGGQERGRPHGAQYAGHDSEGVWDKCTYLSPGSVHLVTSMAHRAHGARQRSNNIFFIFQKYEYTPAVRSKILSKLIFASCVILRSRVLRGVCPHEGYRSATPLGTTV